MSIDYCSGQCRYRYQVHFWRSFTGRGAKKWTVDGIWDMGIILFCLFFFFFRLVILKHICIHSVLLSNKPNTNLAAWNHTHLLLKHGFCGSRAQRGFSMDTPPSGYYLITDFIFFIESIPVWNYYLITWIIYSLHWNISSESIDTFYS